MRGAKPAAEHGHGLSQLARFFARLGTVGSAEQ